MIRKKLFAPFLMLFAGLIAYIILLVSGNYGFRDALLILLGVLVVFYVIGLFIQARVNKFLDENEAKEREEAEKEGAVIEKEAPPSEEEGETESGLPPLTGAGAQERLRPEEEEENAGGEEAPE